MVRRRAGGGGGEGGGPRGRLDAVGGRDPTRPSPRISSFTSPITRLIRKKPIFFLVWIFEFYSFIPVWKLSLFL